MSSTNPKRSPFAADLAHQVAVTLIGASAIENDPKEVNAALALCEIMISTPVEWYTTAERACLLVLVERFYKQPFTKFVLDITTKDVSFYNKCKHYPGLGMKLSMDEIVRGMQQAHAAMA
jgi:hypothetical protein